MNKLTREFYEKYITFGETGKEYLEFRMFDLSKTDPKTGRNPMFSQYAQNIEEVEELIKKYDKDRYIVYVGCNSRPTKTRYDNGVKFRRTFFLDIEMDGEKPPLTDKEYLRKLNNTSLYIWRELHKIKLYPNMLMKSGRGFHLGIKIIPLSTESFDLRFKRWYKDIIKRLMKNRPYPEIKFNDSMVNSSRIESAPGFRHNKYPEKPKREVMLLYEYENNLLPFINRKRVYEIKQQKSFPKYRRKYNDITFYQSPEWLLLANNPDLPEGEIHNKLLLMIKCLARDNKLDVEKLQLKVVELGYNEVIDTPSPDVQYNPWTMFNWAMKNAEFCVKRRIVLPFPFERFRYVVKDINLESNIGQVAVNFPMTKLKTFADIMRYIRRFNYETARREGEKIIIFQDVLWSKIKKSIEDPYLFEYIKYLKIKDFISGDFYKLKCDKRWDDE